jgi:integrase
MNIFINEHISVTVKIVPKKKKTESGIYCLYIAFYPYHNSIPQPTHLVSTGLNVKIADWENGRVNGRGLKANLTNDRIDESLTKTKNMLTQLSVKKIDSYTDLLNELKLNAKQVITGRPPRGKKVEFISKLKLYTYEEVLNNYLSKNQLSKDRVRNYRFTVGLIKEVFEQNVPTLDLITTEDLECVKDYVHYKYPKVNTATTFLSQIATIIKHAVKLKIIPLDPLPERFRGEYVKGERIVLSESDCLKIINLDESKLSQTELVAKYSLIVQLTTGVGYGDLSSIKEEHLTYDNDFNQNVLGKERNKTKIEFIVNLTSRADYSIKKLRELTGYNESHMFSLPSHSYMNRMYKRIVKLSNININVSTYTWRHTFAVQYMDADGRIEDLQKRLGHKDLKTTQIYADISPKRNAEKTILLEANSKIHQLNINNLKAV